MPSSIHRIALVGALAAGLSALGCSADIHDNNLTMDDPTVTFDTNVDVQSITAGGEVPVTLRADNVFLVDPKATPPSGHEDDAGHFQIYLDSTSSAALVVTASVQVKVKIPATTAPGPHKLICRVHRHDGTPTGAQFDLSITVKASVTVGTPPADAGSE